MYRITVICERIPSASWPDALEDVRNEFKCRPWHCVQDVHWSQDTLFLVAVNDYDEDGEALADEFSDIVAANAPGALGYRVSVISVELLDDAPKK